MNATQWFEQGRYYEVNGHNLFTIDTGPSDLPTLCILHGYPTSSYDYWKALPILSQYYRVIIHDHLGYGYSDKPLNYSYSLVDQADIALNLWLKLGVNHTTILAHDYGTSVFTELLARDNQGFCPVHINKVALCNGSMHIELAKLRLIQRLLRNKLLGPFITSLSSKRTLYKNLKNIYVDPSKIDIDEIDAIWHMMNYNSGKQVLPIVSRYTFERKRLWHRWIGALKDTTLPMAIIWPDKDPIAVAAMANIIHAETQNSTLHWLKDIGHFPMLEAPSVWANQVISALSEL